MLHYPGPVYHEKYYCPQPSLDVWLTTMSCPHSYSQIQKDLSIFHSVDMEAVEAEVVSRFRSRGLCHFVVKDNKVHVLKQPKLYVFAKIGLVQDWVTLM